VVIWKIIGVVVLIWIALTLVGWLFKMVIPVLVIGALLFGVYALYKASSSKERNSV
jgi:hypothetical protein